MLRWFSLIVFTLALMTFAFSAVGAAAKTTEKGELSIVSNSQPLKVEAKEGNDGATTTLTLFNSGTKPVPFRVLFEASTVEGVRLEGPLVGTVRARETKLVRMGFGGLEGLHETATGQLMVRSGRREPLVREVEFDPAPQPAIPWPGVLIVASLLVSVILMFIAAPPEDKKDIPAPNPKLSFESIATVLTAAGGLLATVTTAVTFPSLPEQISEQSLLALAALFAALVVLAPFVYEALRKVHPAPLDEKKGRVGTNKTVLIACAITMWGVLGEIALLGLLGWELAGENAGRVFVIVAILIVGGLAIRYFLVSVGKLVQRDWPKEEEEKAQEEAKALKTLPKGGEPQESAELVSIFPTRAYDFQGIDSLLVHQGITLPDVSIDREDRSAEISVPPVVAVMPATEEPARWSLL